MEDEIDISRGDMVVHVDANIEPTNQLQAHIVWMSDESLSLDKHYFFKFSSQMTSGTVEQLLHRIDVNTQEQVSTENLQLNDIALAKVNLDQLVTVDSYSENRATGAFIIIDRMSNITVAAGMVKTPLLAVEAQETQLFEVELKGLIERYYPQKSAAAIDTLVEQLSRDINSK